MSDPTRIPGRIDEEASSIDRPTSLTGDVPQRTEDALGGKVNLSHENREPGPVEEPSEPISDDQANNPTVGKLTKESVERGPWALVFWVLSINVFIWLAYEAVLTILGAWGRSNWFGLLLTILAFILLVVLGRAGRREYEAFKAVDTLALRRERIRIAILSNNLTEIRDALEPTLNNLRQRHYARIAEFEAAAMDRETVSDYVKQFENFVLQHLDEEANSAIRSTALSGGVLVAIIPHPAFDAVAVLWRATTLIRNIGEIYGLKPTGLSSLRLLKHSISTAIIAAGTEVAAGLMLEQMGTDVASKMFSSVSGGAVTVARLYRLGNLTQKLCRPITS